MDHESVAHNEDKGKAVAHSSAIKNDKYDNESAARNEDKGKAIQCSKLRPFYLPWRLFVQVHNYYNWLKSQDVILSHD